MEIDKIKNWEITQKTEKGTDYEFTKRVKGYTVTAHTRKIQVREDVTPLWYAEILLNIEDFDIVETQKVGIFRTRDKARKRLYENIELLEELEDFKDYFDLFKDE